MKLRHVLLKHWTIAMVVIATVAAGLAWSSDYRYRINPDAISYLTIAHKYSVGDFRHAVNGYWSPLLSWVVAPSYWLKIDPAMYVKVFQVFLAGLLALATYQLARINNKTRLIPSAAAMLAGAVGLDWALAGPITPDLLFCLLLAWLAFCVLNFRPKNASTGIQLLLGILGASLYYAKYIGFFIFMGSWVLWLAADYFYPEDKRSNWKDMLRSGKLSMVTFLLLVIPWVALISLKYHTPTIDTSGGYNFSLIGPSTRGDPIAKMVLPPPNSTAVSAWEDPTNLPMVKWSPLSSWKNFSFFWKNVYHNLGIVWSILVSLIAAPVVFAIVYLATRHKQQNLNYQKVILFGQAALLLLLYSIVLVQERYIWFIFIAAIACMAWLARTLSKDFRFAKVIILALMIAPIFGAVHHITKNRGVYKELWQQSQSFRPYINKDSKVAGDTADGEFFCYYIGCKFYGVINPRDPQTVLRQIKQYDIGLLLLTNRSAERLQASGFTLVKTNNDAFINRNLYEPKI